MGGVGCTRYSALASASATTSSVDDWTTMECRVRQILMQRFLKTEAILGKHILFFGTECRWFQGNRAAIAASVMGRCVRRTKVLAENIATGSLHLPLTLAKCIMRIG